MENFEFNRVKKIQHEAANGNEALEAVERPDVALERVKIELKKSYQESLKNGGDAGPEADELKTKYQDLLLENLDLLTSELARTEKSEDPFEKQLHALASEAREISKALSMFVA